MFYLLKLLYFVTLSFSVFGELDPYFKEFLKIVARKQILRSEEIETDVFEDQIKQKDKVENTLEDHGVPSNKYLRELSEYGKDMVIKSTLENSYFCPIPYAKQTHAVKHNPDDFPWIARVYHSPGKELPICTAVAIWTNIFVTAARCLATKKVSYTYVHYNKQVLRPRAFVLPDSPTKQMFDDAGFITVDQHVGVTWTLLNTTNKDRNDKGFFWLDNWKVYGPEYKVVGFVEDYEGGDDLYSMDNVYLSNDICHKLVRFNSSTDAYYVPCFHTCNIEQQRKNDTTCARYLAGLGHAVLEKSGRLVGVVTWTCENDDYVSQHRLPMGVTILNSYTFVIDFTCALNISMTKENKEGFYHVCVKNKNIRTRLDDI